MKKPSKVDIPWLCRTCFCFHSEEKDTECMRFQEHRTSNEACFNWIHWDEKKKVMYDITNINLKMNPAENQDKFKKEIDLEVKDEIKPESKDEIKPEIQEEIKPEVEEPETEADQSSLSNWL